MLLSLLPKEDKIYFINLLRHLVFVGGENEVTEQQIQDKFRYEMGPDVLKYRPANLTRKKIFDYFADKSQTSKNIVYMNLFAASLEDQWYNIENHTLLEETKEAFGISDKKKIELIKIVYANRDLREKAKRTVNS